MKITKQKTIKSQKIKWFLKSSVYRSLKNKNSITNVIENYNFCVCLMEEYNTLIYDFKNDNQKCLNKIEQLTKKCEFLSIKLKVIDKKEFLNYKQELENLSKEFFYIKLENNNLSISNQLKTEKIRKQQKSVNASLNILGQSLEQLKNKNDLFCEDLLVLSENLIKSWQPKEDLLETYPKIINTKLKILDKKLTNLIVSENQKSNNENLNLNNKVYQNNNKQKI